MLAALSPDMLATDLAYYLARKGVCRPVFDWVMPRPDYAGEIWNWSFPLWKRIKRFPSTIRWRHLKTELSLWKRIKCFPFTICRRNLKTELSALKTHQTFSVHNTPEKFENGAFGSENASNVFRPQYAGDIWKRRFHSENTSSVFRPQYAGEIWKLNNHRPFWICVSGGFGRGNHVIIVTSSFSKIKLRPLSKFFLSTLYAKPSFSSSSGLKSFFLKSSLFGP